MWGGSPHGQSSFNGYIASFLASVLSCLAVCHHYGFPGTTQLLLACIIPCCCSCFIFLIFAVSRPRQHIQVILRACPLGWVSGTAAALSVLSFYSLTTSFSLYALFLSSFHFSEYFAVACSNPGVLSLDSFLLNHSKQYWLAAFAGWTEFAVESWLFSDQKRRCWITMTGVAMCLVGEMLRKAAIITAGESFTHLVSYRKKANHGLIMHGVYSLVRHPSYSGWFLWSVGTQMILVNPICAIGYAMATWSFFNERIRHEEITLLNFFGSDYVQYQKRVPSGIPFVRGYVVDHL